MATVLHVSDSDSPGYKRLLLAEPVGTSQSGEYVTGELKDGTGFSLVLHGQREFDVPVDARHVEFPDGSTWKPSARKKS